MDSSVRMAVYNIGTPEKPWKFLAFIPLDRSPVSFEAACASLRSGDWDTRDLSFKIRAMHAISSKVSEELKISRPMSFHVIAKGNNLALSTATPAGYSPEYNVSLFDVTKLSAKDVLKIIPHESHHYCQDIMKKLNMLSPVMVPEPHREKVTEWYGTEYISPLGEDMPGYYAQPIEFDTFEFTHDFLKRHDLPSKDAAADLATARVARDPATRTIVADPKNHLLKLSSLIDGGADDLGPFLPGGHQLGAQKLDEKTICFQIDAIRKDPTLHNNPSLSNIIGHLAHILAPKKVSILLPNKNVKKLFKKTPAFELGDDVLINPHLLLEAKSAQDFVNKVTAHLGVKYIPTNATPNILPK